MISSFHYVFSFILFFTISSLFAQEESPEVYSAYFEVTSSKYEPAILGEHINHMEISILNSYAWIGNTTFSARDARTLFTNTLNGEAVNVDGLLNKLKGKNQFGVGGTVDYFHFAYQFKKEHELHQSEYDGRLYCPGDKIYEEKFTISAGISDRVEVNLKYDEDVFKLYYLTDYTQLLGINSFFNAKLSSFYTREYSMGIAKPLDKLYKVWKVRLGARGKIIQGINAAWTNRSNFNLQVNNDAVTPDGSLDFDYALSARG